MATVGRRRMPCPALHTGGRIDREPDVTSLPVPAVVGIEMIWAPVLHLALDVPVTTNPLLLIVSAVRHCPEATTPIWRCQ